MTPRVIVVGAGVAGLATAYRLLRREPALDLLVLEADAHLGGRLRAVAVDDLELEAGPDAFVARKPWAAELCRELGIGLEAPGASGAYAWTERGLAPLPPTALGVPASVDDLARWAGLSRAGRVRAMADLVRKPRPADGEESLGSLLRRRLGDEATDALVAPLLGGLFAGDVDRLGASATFPELPRWERERGSLIRGARAALAAGRDAGPMFLRPSGGMSSLPRALAEAIGWDRLRPSHPATSVAAAGGLVVEVGEEELPASAVVLATPASVSADLLAWSAPDVSRVLAEIAYVSTAVVLLVYPPGTEEVLPEATGFVVPSGRAPMTAATFVSRKWPSPAFGDRAVLRCFVGAAGTEDVLEAGDDEIVAAVCRHLAALLPLPERAETASAVVRWPRSMPQYEVGHLERVSAIATGLPPGIFVVGNAYGGVGIADTVRGVNETAERVLAHLAGATSEPQRTERVR